MQRSAARAATLPVAVEPHTDAAFERDALALHRSLSELVRMLQFRDRDRICCHDISVTQCYALEALVQRAERGGGCTLNELAADLYLDKSTASRVVDSLVAKGHAARAAHPEDGRAVRLTPTAAGRRLYARIDADLLAEARAVLADFPPDVRLAMGELLRRLQAAAAARILGDACCAPGAAEPGRGAR
jgi:MarR family 2-MHQ and catechol resistance regulon transcriptional repressor